MPPVLAIAAPVRTEARYLPEWVAHHRSLGIDLFLLGDNGGDDGTSELLADMRSWGVFRIDWRGAKHFQLDFMAQVIVAARGAADGLFFVDVDEFLRPEIGADLRDVTAPWLADESVSAVALNWAIYGSGGHVSASDDLVTDRFRWRADQSFSVNRHTKPFLKPDRAAGPPLNPHAVRLASGRYISPNGQDVAWDTTHVPAGITQAAVWDRLRIDHFVLKSREEFEAKRERGSAASALTESQRASPAYFDQHDRNEVFDPVPSSQVMSTRQVLATLGPVRPL